TSEHAYGQIMKALYKRALTGQGSAIFLSMFQSSTSWLTVPITLTASFNKEITRRGNTHEFFSPVSVYEAKDGYVYIAVGNDRQWKSIVSLPEFKELDKPEYEKNSGRIKDVEQLNHRINSITKNYTVDRLIQIFNSITVPISKINKIRDVLNDEYVKSTLLFSKDPKTNTEITLAPPPIMTDFLAMNGRNLSFPPRFGEHNEEIYCGILGITQEKLAELKEKKII
ncbi:MAG: CoA transferase, partial [Desulfatiglandales bacterium]